MQPRMLTHRIIIFLLVAILIASSLTLAAQSDETIVTIGLAPYMVNNNLPDPIFEEFEAAHPGVKVVPVPLEAFYAPAAYSLDEHLQRAQEQASGADVLWINSETITPETTRAGFLLDLSPLVAGDAALDPDDFFPAAWRAFQWDRGMWGLPVTIDLTLLAYSPEKFDAAGIAYPNPNWTLDDLVNADRALAQFDAAGEMVFPGFFMFGGSEAMLLRAFLGQNFYDDSNGMVQPRIDTPELNALVDDWIRYREEGLLGSFQPQGQFDLRDVPLRLERSNTVYMPSGDTPQALAMLPGDVGAAYVNGFAVSSGTANPRLAYELVKYLTANPSINQLMFSVSPARRSMIGAEGHDMGFTGPSVAPEYQDFVNRALENALSSSDLLFGEYVARRIREANEMGTTLQEIEADAQANLATAEARRDTTTVFVATPVPTPVLAPGEIALNFGLMSFFSSSMLDDTWTRVIDDFTSTDPEVRQINRETSYGSNVSEMAEQYDCFYLPYNGVPGADITTAVLSLDPFLDADPNFDPNDLMGSVLQQVRRDNRTWAYPLNVQPDMLWLSRNRFEQAGVPIPENGWTVDQFADALRRLKSGPDDPTPFQPHGMGGLNMSHLLQLIAAYGGLPLDSRVYPPEVDFTSPETADAIRQVLDLVKAGYIDYSQLSPSMGGGGVITSGTMLEEVAIVNDNLITLAFRQMPGTPAQPQVMVTYPAGTRYVPISYDIGTAYISASTPNPAACYRWIKTLVDHPELFGSMPVRRSQVNDPDFAAVIGADLTSVYSQIEAVLQNPLVVEFPTQFVGNTANGVGMFIMQIWLARSFDRYVLEDADLDSELADAEIQARAYADCIGAVPPVDMSNVRTPEEQMRALGHFITCAVTADPSLAELFPQMPGE